MKNKLLLQFMFIGIALILDGIVMAIFPVDYSFQKYFFNSMISFSLVVLFLRDQTALTTIYMSLFLGLFLDLTTFNGYFVNTACIVASSLILYQWGKRLSFNLLESIMLILVGCFMREVMVYFVAYVQGLYSISFYNFLQKEVFGTVIVNLFLSVIAFYLLRKYNRLYKHNEQRLRRSEKSLWYR